jgi:hypothetical protein
MKTAGSRLHIYTIEFGAFDKDLDHKLGSIRSIRDDLEKVIGKFVHYGKSIFTRVQLE